MSVGQRIVDASYVENVRFLVPDAVPAQTTTFREGDRARLKLGRVVLRVGYAKIPSDYHEEARSVLHSSFTPDTTSVLAHLQARTGRTIRGRQTERRLVDAIAYALASADRFGGDARGVVVGDRPDLVDREFVVGDVRRHQIGYRYGASGGAGVSGYYDDSYEPGGLDERRTIVTVDTGLGLMRMGKPWDGIRVLTGDLEIVERAKVTRG